MRGFFIVIYLGILGLPHTLLLREKYLKNLGRLFLCVCALLNSVFAQDAELDSLKRALKNAKHDSVRIDSYLALGEEIYQQDPDSAFYFWSQAKQLTEEKLKEVKPSGPEFQVFQKRYATSLYNLGFIYNRQGDIP